MLNPKATVVRLERHAYAPELNRSLLSNGKTIKTPSCNNIAEAQAHIDALSMVQPLYAKMNADGKFSYSAHNPSIPRYNLN